MLKAVPTKATLKDRRHRPERIVSQRKRRTYFRRFFKVAAVIAAIGLLGAIYLIWASGVIVDSASSGRIKLMELSMQMGLKLENVYIDGLDHLNNEDIVAIIPESVSHYPLHRRHASAKSDIPIYAISLPKLKKQIEALGWVESAQVERQLPHSLLITVKERIPRVIWKKDDAFFLVDQHGVIISEGVLHGYNELPIIIGNNVIQPMQSLVSFAYKYPEISQSIESIVWVNERRWNIGLVPNITIMLPEQNPADAWDILYDLHQEKDLLERSIASVDLRNPERYYIELTDEAKRFIKAREKEAQESKKKD